MITPAVARYETILKRLIAVTEAETSMLAFTRLMMPSPRHPDDPDHSRYEVQRFHEVICAALEELEAGRKSGADPVKLALDRLIERLNRVMDAMGEIKGINDLITALRAIEKGQEQDIGGVLRRIKKEKEDELFRKIGALQ
jgi:uncharacterized protein (DUF885 family)